MGTIVHITGTTSGLGEALAKAFCQLPDVVVYGYARREATLTFPNYHHLHTDLAEVGSETSLHVGNACDSEILINNAGSLGPVAPIGQMKAGELSRMWMINTAAVMEWTNRFVAESKARKKTVITISSGAGARATASWSAYCASKAAINMATEVWNIDHPDMHFLAIAPGIVDTEMQAEIRTASKEQFPDIEKFIGYHENGDLKSSDEIAQIILPIALRPDSAPSSVFSVRELL